MFTLRQEPMQGVGCSDFASALNRGWNRSGDVGAMKLLESARVRVHNAMALLNFPRSSGFPFCLHNKPEVHGERPPILLLPTAFRRSREQKVQQFRVAKNPDLIIAGNTGTQWQVRVDADEAFNAFVK